jgi:hypothetical protein
MITCDVFRAQFSPATDDAVLLDHLRSCDACLTFAAEKDGDVLFRSLGGDELVPPGGVDAFVEDVMRAVHIRSAENSVSSRGVRWPRKVAIAATIAAAITGATMVYEYNRAPIVMPPVAHHTIAIKSASKPIIETYDSQKATIVEVPTEGEDVKMVMVFDDSLPADL